MRTISASKNDKKKVFIEWQNDISSTSKRDRFKHLQRQAQTALRGMQYEWWEKQADKIETYAATKNSKMFFRTIKEVYGAAMPRSTPLLPADSSALLKEKSSINTRWREHFSTLLNKPSTVDPTVLDQIPQKPVPASTSPQRSMKFRRRSNRPAWENPLGWTGFLQRSSSQPVQWSSKHSTHSSPASGKKRMCQKNSGMPH